MAERLDNTLKRSTPVRWLPRVFIAVALVVYGAYLVVYASYALALFRFPFDYDQGEGFELRDSVLFSQGEWPYRDNSQYPFYSSNYPPLYHLLVVPLIWLFGPHYWTGRLVSFLATLITAAAIGWAVQRHGRRPWLAALCGLAFLASNYVYHVGPLFRLHMTMVMFETLAVVAVGSAFRAGPDRDIPHQGRLWIAIALLLAAGYTKQTAVVTCVAVLVFVFLRTPRQAILLAGALAATALALFGLINLATDGQWWLNTVVANANPWIMEQAVGLYRQWFRLHSVLTILALVFAVYELYWDRLSVYSVWFFVSVAGSVMAGKWGAGESYFTTAIAASCIVAGIGLGRALTWAEKSKPQMATALGLAIPLLFVLQARLVFHLPTDTRLAQTVARLAGQSTATLVAPQTSCSAPQPARWVPYVDTVGVTLLGKPPTADDAQAGREIARYIQESALPAISEDAGFSMYAGADVVTNPTQLLNLHVSGRLDMVQLLAMIEQKQFGVVVFRAQFYPPAILEAIGQNYHTVDTVEMNNFVYCILKPRQAAQPGS